MGNMLLDMKDAEHESVHKRGGLQHGEDKVSYGPLSPFGDAVIRVLRECPSTWRTIESRSFTYALDKALHLLLETSFLEARIEAWLCMEGADQTVHLVALVSGDFKARFLGDALGCVPDWLDGNGKLKQMCLICFRILEARLTGEGELAKRDLSSPNRSSVAAIIHGGWPRKTDAVPTPKVTIESWQLETRASFDVEIHSQPHKLSKYLDEPKLTDCNLVTWRLRPGDTPDCIALRENEEEERRSREDMQHCLDCEQQVAEGVHNGDLEAVLSVLATDLVYWGRSLKHHMFNLFHQYEMEGSGFFSAGIVPFWFARPIVGAEQAFEMVEVHLGVDYAAAFGGRIDGFYRARHEFLELATGYDGPLGCQEYYEFFAQVDDARSAIRKRAFALAEHVRLLGSQVRTKSGPEQARSGLGPHASAEPSNIASCPRAAVAPSDETLEEATRPEQGGPLLHPEIYHSDISPEQYTDIHKASEWAWECVKDLAKYFCEHLCSACRPDDLRFKDRLTPEDAIAANEWLATGERERIIGTWREKQHNLHEAFRYLPDHTENEDGCPACAIANGLISFPAIAHFSPVRPITEVVHSWYMDNKGVVVLDPYAPEYDHHQPESFPCCKFSRFFGGNLDATFERTRENVLLHLDMSQLPPMSPPDHEALVDAFAPGQKVAKKLKALADEGTAFTVDDRAQTVNRVKKKPKVAQKLIDAMRTFLTEHPGETFSCDELNVKMKKAGLTNRDNYPASDIANAKTYLRDVEELSLVGRSYCYMPNDPTDVHTT